MFEPVFIRKNQPLLMPVGAIHVWRCRLTRHLQLSSEETSRAEKFVSPDARHAYVMSRAGLRELCSTYLRRAPENLRFVSGAGGKPRLDPPDLEFNLSHTGRRVFAAFARQPVGLDVENPHRNLDWKGIAKRFFHPGELSQIHSASDARLEFFRVWTAKEAVLKLFGTGLGEGLAHVKFVKDGEVLYDGRAVKILHFQAESLVGAVAMKTDFAVKGWFDLQS